MLTGSRLFGWMMTGLIALTWVSGVIAKPYALTTPQGVIEYELRTDAIAVGFTKTVDDAAKADLLSAIPEVAAKPIEREAPALGMTIVSLKPGSRESDVESILEVLESYDDVDWVAPVLLHSGLEHVPGPYLFVSSQPMTHESLLEQYDLELDGKSNPAAGLLRVKRPKGSGTGVLELCNQIAGEPAVRYAEPDFMRVMRLHTTDTYYDDQWHLNNTGQWPAYGTPGADIDAPEAWTYETGDASIVISICDVGVEITHPDLDGHIETGYDAVDSDNDPNPETGNDGHGTCCAGLAAAETNNSAGVAGVGYNCHLMGVKMGYIINGNQIQSYDSWIIECFDYSRLNADVMSNSWGGGSPSTAVTDTINYAKATGLTIFFSSGNDDGPIYWPSNLASVITVGATNEHDERCDPSDWGAGQGSDYGPSIDVCAPGNDIPTTDMAGSDGYASGSYYFYFGGTSAACPIAAGLGGLILSVDPSLTPNQVEAVIEATAEDQVGDPSEDTPGFDNYHGWGRVNANAAVRYVFGAPSNLVAEDNQPTVPLTWDPPWRTPLRYDIYRSTTGQYGFYGLLDDSPTPSYEDTDVEHLQTYWYKVKAVYSSGESEYSNADSGTPYISFDPPQNLVAFGGQDGVVPVSWGIPATGTPDHYELYRSDTGEFGTYNLIYSPPSTSHDDYTVVNGNEYWYKAKAVYTSPSGTSDFSNADNATPEAPPIFAPELYHDALDDFEPGTGTITAISIDPDAVLAVLRVEMFYRPEGGGSFDSLELTGTGNPDEFAADLSGFAEGSYEYYVKSTDDDDADTTAPATAPADLYQFDVDELCGSLLAYDDATAESYNYAIGDSATLMRWAVRFTPSHLPYYVCGASFAAARTIPDTAHHPIEVAVMLADGAGGLPGTTVWQGINGSIGNVIGGLPLGTHFADVVIRDAGDPLLVNGDFYIVVDNLNASKSEAFGRDQTAPNQHVSYFWDACDELWYSEDDTGLSDNAYPGNRMIRAYGYSLQPPVIVVNRDGNDIRLRWDGTGAVSYLVYSDLDPDGSFTNLEGTVSDTTFLDTGAFADDEVKFYQVRSSAD